MNSEVRRILGPGHRGLKPDRRPLARRATVETRLGRPQLLHARDYFHRASRVHLRWIASSVAILVVGLGTLVNFLGPLRGLGSTWPCSPGRPDFGLDHLGKSLQPPAHGCGHTWQSHLRRVDRQAEPENLSFGCGLSSGHLGARAIRRIGARQGCPRRCGDLEVHPGSHQQEGRPTVVYLVELLG